MRHSNHSFVLINASQIAIFLFAEVLPIWVSVRCGVLNHFSERDVGDNPAPTRYQTLPQDPNSIVLASQHNVVSLYEFSAMCVSALLCVLR